MKRVGCTRLQRALRNDEKSEALSKRCCVYVEADASLVVRGVEVGERQGKQFEVR